ncbi:MAG: glycosyltransferase family 2 protein [Bacillota bacterium]|nr:glycosyltransferase family 2 protein [Bacillota bacterium]
MIVKNEEDCIARCLESVKDIVDEIIIVDTGSSDHTIEICKSFGADIHYFPWNGNFSEARNFGINLATGDWILWLDADEEVDKHERLMLRDLLYTESFDILALHLINFYGETVDHDKVIEIGHYRLFRSGLGIQFVNRIHEVLQSPEHLKLREKGRIGFTDLKLYHYGYMNQTVVKKNKHERNLELLEQELKEGNGNAWTHYYIAAEYNQMQKYKEAFAHANLSIYEFLKAGHVPPPSILYKLKYSILISTGSLDGALPGIEKAVALYPDYVELRYQMGTILYFKEEYAKAAEVFAECILMGEDNLTHLITKGVGSFHSWYFKGLCLKKLNKKTEEALCYLNALTMSETYAPALNALIDLVHEGEFTVEECIEKGFQNNTGKGLPSSIKALIEKNR